jgi:Na+-driven multidrug efflux pump
MKDLTEGSIASHLVRMAVPIGIGMVFQTLYLMVDLYFVSRLGDAAIAGVSAAGNLQFLVMALTQVLGVGSGALIAHAAGRKDRDEANLIFNQSLGLAALCALITSGPGTTWLPSGPTRPPSRLESPISTGSCREWGCSLH